MLGNNLIFLISQPRAGSTMLQRILGSHPEIHTTSEPWIMLHPLYAMKKNGIETEYSSELALDGLKDFLSQIENGEAVYRDNIRQMYKSLYEKLLDPTSKKYYLDKTPRYYFIINELYELFPEAKFIILFRNPLAVLSSIIESWTKQDWFSLGRNKSDLLHAPDLLLNGVEQLGNAHVRIQYEKILENPESEINKICDFIGISFDKKIIEYGNNSMTRWQYGDQKTVHEKTKPEVLHSDKWTRSLENPQVWRIMNEYLDYLGEDRINRMGYSFSELDEVMINNKPEVDINKTSVSLFTLLDNARDALLERKQLGKQLRLKNGQIRQKDQQIKEIKDQLIQKSNPVQLKERQLKAAQEQIINLTAMLKESEADRAARLENMKKLTEMLKVSETDRANRLEVINKLEERISFLERQQKEIERLHTFYGFLPYQLRKIKKWIYRFLQKIIKVQLL